MKKNRKECILCGNKTENLFSLNMPIFMGVNKNNAEEIISKMNFDFCDNCGEIQIRDLIDLDLLYMNNHNEDVVGGIWKRHYEEFRKFISPNIKDKVVLEISDPSAKVAKICTDYKRWFIVEPNYIEQNLENVEFIKSYFEEFETKEKYDIIINSHLLEHIHNPDEFFSKCFNLLKDDGCMIISIPNMDYLIHHNVSPVNFLHFEHTYFINSEVLEYLANKNGFSVKKEKKFESHSLFFRLEKSKKTSVLPNLHVKKLFLNHFKNKIKNIEEINSKINLVSNSEVFLFGAHVSSQFVLHNGLDEKKIISILDNSNSKQNQKLYGSSLFVNSPEIIKNKYAVVICSHLGIYKDEVIKQLKEINPSVIII